MKILQLRFKNLNSLVGEWHIDFSHPDYIEAGLFAITGPTGAGKSTLLDALCLALYGRTPRLGRITQSSNEIMSRQSGACFAEVCFETTTGRYRSHWSHHRARQKVDGALQAPKHEIADDLSGKLLASQSSVVPAQVEQITGMDFERFTRSMLLAQGDFAAFLHADANNRAPILEQMTGTQIYSDLSMHVHERTRQAESELQQLSQQLDQLNVLDPQAEQALVDQLKQHQTQRAAMVLQAAELQAAKHWLEQQQRLNQELQRLATAHSQWQQRWEQFAPDRVRLANALRALDLEGAHASLQTMQQQQQDDQQRAQKLHTQFEQLQLLSAGLEQQLAVAKQQDQQGRQTLEKLQPVLQQIQQLQQQASQLQQLKQQSVNAHSTVKQAQQAYERRLHNQQQLQRQLEQAQQQSAQLQLQLEQVLAGRLLREYRQHYESALKEKYLVDRIHQLEKQRAALELGQPCPLCGALEHPFTKEALLPDAQAHDQALNVLKERITQAELLEQQLSQQQQQLEQLIKATHDAQQQKLNAQHAQQLAQQRHQQLLEQYQQQQQLEQAQQQELAHQLKELGFDQPVTQIALWAQQLQAQAQAATVAYQQALENTQLHQQQLYALQQQSTQLQQQLQQRQPKISQLQLAFTAQLQAHGFASHSDYEQACLSATQRQQLQQQQAELLQQQQQLNSQQQHVEQHLHELQVQALSTQSHAELLVQQQQLEQELEQLNTQLAQLQLTYQQNERLKHQHQSQQARLLTQQRLCARWQNLHVLIGSADGKKYRNFAQGLSFEIMVHYANQHLQKMSDRYVLIRDSQQPLELNVLDQYQAGEIRSTKNLSGGESFIVSLALALGLSQMASQKIQVHSLFLDEGFGTLDEEALDIALDTLANLHQENKLIGVISHVPTLKARIGTQIQIQPLLGGRSTLSGPGCSSIS